MMIINNNYCLQSNNNYCKIYKNSQIDANSLPNNRGKIAFTSLPLGLYNDRLISKQNFTSSTEYHKGSSPEVAQKLKKLNGSLDQKLAQAKNIILGDLGLNPDLLKLVDKDCGPDAYAGYSPANGVIGYSKAMCQKQNSQFSDDAVICILRHEIDHMVVCAKIYKVLGPEGFDKFIQNNYYMKQLPPKERIVNYDFYKEISQYLDVSDFNAQPYIDAFNNYNKGVEQTGTNYSNCRLFTFITNNFDNELEISARKVQYELEEQMGVTTLKDFYSMIEHTKKLKDKISDFIYQNPTYNVGNDTVEILFDYLYHKSSVEMGLKDTTKNWGNILANAETKVQSISKHDIEEARKYRSNKLMSNNNS